MSKAQSLDKITKANQLRPVGFCSPQGAKPISVMGRKFNARHGMPCTPCR